MIQDVIDAISLGSLSALFALGIAVIFGIMRSINFAHGELIMVGAFAVVLIPLPLPALIPVTVAIVVALALAMERIAFRPVRQASAETLLITSFALSSCFRASPRSSGGLCRERRFASSLSSSFTSARSRSRSSTWLSSP